MGDCGKRKYIALTGITAISTANSNLDGTGSMGTVLTAANDGTIINSITVKSTGNNSEGMIRLFITKNGTTSLWQELPVPSNVQSATYPAFQRSVQVQFSMEAGDILKASTQYADDWVIIADAVKWINETEPTVQLDTPATLTLQGIDEAIDCDCSDVTNADSYEWQRADDDLFTINVVTGSLTLSEFTFGGLTNNQTYYVRARATGSGYIASNWISGDATPSV